MGVTKSGLNVFAGIGYSFISGSNALFVLTGTTSYTLNTFSFSTAGTLTTADLNGDGNGDLVVVNSVYITSLSGRGLLCCCGNPDGRLSRRLLAPYSTAGAASVAAVIDDLNGDGKLDIVTCSDTQELISVLDVGKGD